MANFLWYVVIFVVSYLIGSINLSIVLCKKIKGQDIRDLGSGNAGTTNTLRILGKGPAALTLLFDMLIMEMVSQFVVIVSNYIFSKVFVFKKEK